MLVDGDLAEVLPDCFEHLLYLSLRGLLEEHLAQEVSKRVHHQFMEGCILEEKLMKYIFYELRWCWILLLRQPGHLFSDFVLEHLTPFLISCEK